MKIREKLLELTELEGEGVGMWYEYMAKRKVLARFSKDCQSLLVFGLPEKYGLGVDNLTILGNVVTVVDPRRSHLDQLKKIARIFLKNKEFDFVCQSLDRFSPNRKFDLVVNTEVIQRFEEQSLASILKKMNNLTKKRAVVFVPNGESYAHPRISGLAGCRLEQLKKEMVRKTDFRLIESGYVDIPPWPSGLTIQSTAKGTRKSKPSLAVRLVNGVSHWLIPFLVSLEKWYPSFLVKFQAHLIYLVLEK